MHCAGLRPTCPRFCSCTVSTVSPDTPLSATPHADHPRTTSGPERPGRLAARAFTKEFVGAFLFGKFSLPDCSKPLPFRGPCHSTLPSGLGLPTSIRFCFLKARACFATPRPVSFAVYLGQSGRTRFSYLAPRSPAQLISELCYKVAPVKKFAWADTTFPTF